MLRLIRAGGIAAATLLLAAAAANADPSSTDPGADQQPSTASYIDHATATPDSSVFDAAADAHGLPAALEPTVVTTDPVGSLAPHLEAATTVPARPANQRQSLSELVTAYGGAEPASTEQECLAGAVYFESKGEPLRGQLAVAEVILNRAKSGKFPASICGVVKQKRQFSFVRGGRIPAIPRASEAWRKAVAIARIAQRDLADSAARDAMFFHATHVQPGWRNRTRLASVGNHIFYR